MPRAFFVADYAGKLLGRNPDGDGAIPNTSSNRDTSAVGSNRALLSVGDRGRPEDGNSREAEQPLAHGFGSGFCSGQLPVLPAVIVAPLTLPPAATLPQLAWTVGSLVADLFGWRSRGTPSTNHQSRQQGQHQPSRGLHGSSCFGRRSKGCSWITDPPGVARITISG